MQEEPRPVIPEPAAPEGHLQRGRRCPRCGEVSAHRSQSRSVREHLLRTLVLVRPYSCHRCGWRGWRLWAWKGAARYEVPKGPTEEEIKERRRAQRKKERKRAAVTPRRRLLGQLGLALALGALAGAFFYYWYGGGE